MLELVRCQKKEDPKEPVEEKKILTSAQIFSSEKNGMENLENI